MNNALLTLLGGFAVSVLPAADCKPALAFSLGISGPKEWLKEQKKKTAEFLLAPIIASRDKLNNAYYLLKTGEITFNEDHREAQRLVKAAARDCIPLERGSLVAFQASTGVEVCTFRLIVKNAASLLDDSDPIKVKADAAFNDLIRSFAILDELVESGEPGVVRNSEKLGGAFAEAFVALDKFETSIKHCLGV